MKKDKVKIEKIRQIKKLLPHGSIKKIAEQTGMIELSISKILDGQWNNEKVIYAALDILDKHQKETNELIQYFKKKT